jgi:two-component system, NarL family, response regulator DesR
MSPPLPRCLVADDHPALVAAVSAFLAEKGFDVVATAADGVAAVEAARATSPDVVLLDYRMPHLAGADLVRALRRAAPESALAVYTAEADDGLVTQALHAGAAAVVLKEAPLADLVRALGAILAGDSYVDPALGVGALGAARARGVTEREARVLALLSEGLTYEQIGERLAISPETVRTHLQKASERLGAATRTQAVATAIRLGLIA